MTPATKEHFNEHLMSKPGKYGYDLAAYEATRGGANMHPGADLHPNVFFSPECKYCT